MRNFISEIVIQDLEEMVPDGLFQNVDLSEISRWKIGGIADCVIRPRGTKQVSKLISYLSENAIPYLVIGSTSNLLFADEGIRAIILQIGKRMSDYRIKEDSVWVQAGKWVPGFAKNIAQAGLSGIEHTAGIPGTIGGLICMNGGSQRKGIGSHIKSVTAVSPNGEIKIFRKKECHFAYRTSVFQKNKFVITDAELEFSERKKYSDIRDEMLEILRERRAKFPQKLPNGGSTFMSNPEIYKKYGPPGKVIEDLGYKGCKIGGAEVSQIHANFINNTGSAKARDVLGLIEKIRNDVFNQTGFYMRSEVKFVNEMGDIKPADLLSGK